MPSSALLRSPAALLGRASRSFHRAIVGCRSLASTSPPSSSASVYRGPSFVFDIDGVLWRSRTPLPPAVRALRALYDSDACRWRHPVVFLTNAGGETEAHRAAALSNAFDVPVDESAVVLCHTPLRALAHDPRFCDRSVLTIGGEKCAHIARSYGFPYALDTSHLAAIRRYISPFSSRNVAAPVVSDAERAALARPIAAVLLMTDSRDWLRDVQILLDIYTRRFDRSAATRPENDKTSVVHKGEQGAEERARFNSITDGNPNCEHGDHVSAADTDNGEGLPDFYITNPDILFPTKHPYPRLAGGSLQIAFNAVLSHVTDHQVAPPTPIFLGKPYAPNYNCAEQSIRTQLLQMGYEESSSGPIYAFGDNPKSDIRGGNNRGHPWKTVLVRTGNFGINDDVNDLPVEDRPYRVVGDVLQGVKLALKETNTVINDLDDSLDSQLSV